MTTNQSAATPLATAEDARLHLGAMLDVLRTCKPDYPLAAWLYLSNLESIHARLVRVIESLSAPPGNELTILH